MYEQLLVNKEETFHYSSSQPEFYLMARENKKTTLVSKLRLSTHKLEIELGRYD